MDWQNVAENVINSCMDCIEECIGSLSSTRGRRLLEVFIVCIFLLASSVICRVLELPAFITWQEAVPAVVISGYLAFMSCINASVVKVVKRKLAR